MKSKNTKIISAIILTLIIVISGWIFYIYQSSAILNANTSHYQKVLKQSLVEIDKKNKDMVIQTNVFDKLNNPAIVPYIDKTEAKLIREIDVVINSKDNKTQAVALEVFDFDKSVNVEKLYDYIENKTQFKYEKKLNKLIFINLVGSNETKIRNLILEKLKDYKEYYK